MLSRIVKALKAGAEWTAFCRSLEAAVNRAVAAEKAEIAVDNNIYSANSGWIENARQVADAAIYDRTSQGHESAEFCLSSNQIRLIHVFVERDLENRGYRVSYGYTQQEDGSYFCGMSVYWGSLAQARIFGSPMRKHWWHQKT